jgi:hypothetical protein
MLQPMTDGVTVDIVEKGNTRAELVRVQRAVTVVGTSLFSESTPRLSYHITGDTSCVYNMSVRFGNYRLMAYREFH